MVTIGRWTGRETRLLRQSLRLTVRHFAEDLGISPRTVSKWEAAGATRFPRPELQAALDTMLAQATDDERERFEKTRRESTAPQSMVVRHSGSGFPLPLTADEQIAIPSPDPKIGVTAVLDRSTSRVPANVMKTLTPEEREQLLVSRENPRRYLDAAVIATLARQLDACKVDDQAVGPTGALPVVVYLLRLIDELAKEATPEIRRQLLVLGAHGAEFMGWLYRDLHDLHRAEHWYNRATAWAQESGDLPMQGYILLKRSQMAYDERDAMRVVAFGQAAWEGPWRLPAKVQAEACQQTARGMAMTGSSLDAVQRRLDQALAVLHCGTDDPDESTHLATHYDLAHLRLQTASCYLEVGQPLMASSLYGEVLTADGLKARDRGYFLARQAYSMALAGQPDDASTIGLNADRFAEATRSARTRRELNRVSQALTPWHNRPGPRALRDTLAS